MSDALFFFLLLGIPYVILIFYGVRRWRRLDPRAAFQPQVRGFLPETVLFAVVWFILALGVAVVLTLASDGGGGAWLDFLVIAATVILLPYYFGYALVAGLLAGPERTIIVGQTPPSVWDVLAFIAWPLGILAGMAVAAGLLVLLSYILWWVKRAQRAAPVAPGGAR